MLTFRDGADFIFFGIDVLCSWLMRHNIPENVAHLRLKDHCPEI